MGSLLCYKPVEGGHHGRHSEQIERMLRSNPKLMASMMKGQKNDGFRNQKQHRSPPIQRLMEESPQLAMAATIGALQDFKKDKGRFSQDLDGLRKPINKKGSSESSESKSSESKSSGSSSSGSKSSESSESKSSESKSSGSKSSESNSSGSMSKESVEEIANAKPKSRAEKELMKNWAELGLMAVKNPMEFRLVGLSMMKIIRDAKRGGGRKSGRGFGAAGLNAGRNGRSMTAIVSGVMAGVPLVVRGVKWLVRKIGK